MKSFVILSISILSIVACKQKNVSLNQNDDKIFDSLFFDSGTEISFDTTATGKIPSGWTSSVTGKNLPGKWEVVDEKEGKVIGQTSSRSSGYMFNMLVFDNYSLKDLALSVEIKAMGGREDQGGGLVWRYQDADNYYLARANPLESNFRLYKVINGNRKQLKSYNLPVTSNIWHNITVIHKGNSIQCYFDGQLFIETLDSTITEKGKAGFWTKADAQTYFNDLKISDRRIHHY
jgi:hypothetical protein